MYILSVFDVCFVGLFVFLKRPIQQNKECKHHIKGKNYFGGAKSSKFSVVQMEHLHTCPLHLKLMPTTSLSHILHTEQTRHNAFDYISTHNWRRRKFAPKLQIIWSEFFPVGCNLSCLLMHICFLFTIAENTSQ